MRSAFAVIVDFLVLVGLGCLAASGAIMRWKLPPGSETQGFPIGKRFQFKLEGPTLLGWDRAQWSQVHFWLAAVFVGIVLVHFALSWSKKEQEAR